VHTNVALKKIAMPRKSKRLKVLNYINTMNDELFYWSVHRSLTGQNDVVQDGFDLDFFYMTEDVINNRFLFRPSKYRKLMSSWMDFFSDDHFTDDEFREHFRVSQVSFHQLYEVIKHNPIFSSTKKRRSQTPIQLQLMIFLFKLSSSGTGGKFKRIGKYFKVSEGNSRRCFERVLMAVLSLRDEVVSWPSEHERKVYLVVS